MLSRMHANSSVASDIWITSIAFSGEQSPRAIPAAQSTARAGMGERGMPGDVAGRHAKETPRRVEGGAGWRILD